MFSSGDASSQQTQPSTEPEPHIFFHDSYTPPDLLAFPNTPLITNQEVLDPFSRDDDDEDDEDDDDEPLEEYYPPHLPTVYLDVWRNAGISAPMLKALILSQISGESQTTTINSRLALYGKALENFSSNFSLHSQNHHVAIAALLLFASVETTLGTFIGAISHMKQADALVAANVNQLRQSSIGRDLVCQWLVLRNLCSVQVFPWGKFESFNPRLDDLLQEAADEILDTSGSATQKITTLFCTASHVHYLLTLSHIVGINDSFESYRSWKTRMASIGLRTPDSRLHSSSIMDLWLQLDSIRAQLDAWHATLPSEAQPILSLTSLRAEELEASDAHGLQIEPLRFQSAKYAMTYACYCTAQLMCSRSLFEATLKRSEEHFGRLNLWVRVILQIAAGLDPSLHDQQQTELLFFQIEWLIGICVLPWCNNRDAIQWIYDWVLRLEEQDVMCSHSGGRWMLRALIKKKLELYDDGKLMLTYFTGIHAHDERSSLFTQTRNSLLLLHGRCMATGRYFNTIDTVEAS